MVIIYIYEFYQHTIKLKTQIKKDNKYYNKTIERFDIDPYCEVIQHNFSDLSEHKLETPIYSHDALRNIKGVKDKLTEDPTSFMEDLAKSDTDRYDHTGKYVENTPLPFDDQRANYNKEFTTLLTMSIPPRIKRDPRWHCIRDYMTCSKPPSNCDTFSKCDGNEPLEKNSKIYELYQKLEKKH